METNAHTTSGPALDDLRVQRAFAAVKTSSTVYGALGVAALAAVVVVASSGQPVSTFMWVRAVLLPVVDLVPGICPPWYAVMQVVCMLPVVRVAFLTRGSVLRPARAA